MRQKLSSESGNITVFLTLLIVVFLSITLTSVEVVRFQQARLRIRRSMLSAAEHTLADYQVQLADRYHIYLLDETYNGAGKEVWFTRLQEHLEYTLNGSKEFYQFQIEDVNAEVVKRVADDGGEPLVREIMDWILYSGIPKTRTQKAMSVRESQKDEGNEKDQSLIDLISQFKSMGKLMLLLDDPGSVSKVKVDTSELVTSDSKGTYSLGAKEKLATMQYIFQHFNSATTQIHEENQQLDYEIEYLIAGGDNDCDNLESIVDRIIGLRVIPNAVYLFTSPEKMEEALTLATTIAGATALPPVVFGVQVAIIAAWAYAESLVDIKILLQGNKVPAIKTNETWNLSLDQLAKLTISKGSKENTEGQSWDDYLKMFITLDSGKHVLRMLDVMQLNLTIENPDLRLSNCIYSYQVNGRVSLLPKFASLPFPHEISQHQSIHY